MITTNDNCRINYLVREKGNMTVVFESCHWLISIIFHSVFKQTIRVKMIIIIIQKYT